MANNWINLTFPLSRFVLLASLVSRTNRAKPCGRGNAGYPNVMLTLRAFDNTQSNWSLGGNMATYKRNFITGVIFRIDFSKPIDIYTDRIPEELESTIMKNMQMKEIHETKNEELMIDSLKNNISRRTVEVREHNYYGNEKTKRLAFSKDYFFAEFSKYISYQDFYDCVRPVIDYMRSNGSIESKRIGFRYINQFHFDEPDVLKWEKYLNSKITNNIDFLDERYTLSRAFTKQEYIIGSNRIQIQYGIINPDFPGPVVKKHYVLDIDVSRNGSNNACDFYDTLDEMHKIQEEIFEMSITDEMRGYLNA